MRMSRGSAEGTSLSGLLRVACGEDAWGPSGGLWGPKIMEGIALALEVKTWKSGSQGSDSGDIRPDDSAAKPGVARLVRVPRNGGKAAAGPPRPPQRPTADLRADSVAMPGPGTPCPALPHQGLHPHPALRTQGRTCRARRGAWLDLWVPPPQEGPLQLDSTFPISPCSLERARAPSWRQEAVDIAMPTAASGGC